MSDLTRYRPATTEEINDATEGNGDARFQWVAPDSTLQQIADAWNYDDTGQGRHEFRQQWPELADLLDALEVAEVAGE